MIPAWLQEIAVWAILMTAAVALVRRFAGGRARACPACAPPRRAPATGIRARGLTILP